MKCRRIFSMGIGLVAILHICGAAAADSDALAEMARKAQDPLADMRGLLTDNTIAFDGGPDANETSYGFQLQPVYSIPNETRFNMIARAVIPIVGVDPGVRIPPLGPDPRPASGNEWGLSDIILQYFIAPKTDAGVKWGIGPQVSLKTRTSDRQAGPGWGAGIAGILFAGVGNWNLGGVAFQHWGDQDNFNMASVQPIVMYSFESFPGVYMGYNNSITYNWKADSDKLTLPVGLTIGRTFLLSSGNGLDLSIGAYKLVARPQDAPKWQLKFGISYLLK